MALPKMLAFVHNPVVLGVVTIIAIGIIGYEIIKHKQEKQKKQRYGYGPSPPPDSPTLPPSPPPTPKKDTRRLKPDKRDGSKKDDPDDQESDAGSKTTVAPADANENSIPSEDGQVNDSPSNHCNLNLNSPNPEKEIVYEKNVLTETSDTNRPPSQRVRRRRRSVRKSGSDSAESSESSYRSKKLNAASSCKNIPKPSSSRNDHLSEKSDEPRGINSTTDDYVSSSYSVLTESEDDTYKRKVYNNIQHDNDKVTDSNCLSSSSVGSSVREVLKIHESGICQACEENRVNTRAEPCNHQYLCLSCARSVHRVYKRCSICRCCVVQFRII